MTWLIPIALIYGIPLLATTGYLIMCYLTENNT